MLPKEIKENINEKQSHGHGLEGLILLRCQYCSKAIYRFNAISAKMSISFFFAEKNLY
jgi:hypothetical protein